MFRIIKDKILGKTKPKIESQNTVWKFTESLNYNKKLLKEIFENDDTVIFREFECGVNKKVKSCIIYINGMVDNDTINNDIILPTMKHDINNIDIEFLLNTLKNNVIASDNVKKESDLNLVISSLLYGNSLLLLDGIETGLIIATKGWTERALTEPIAEAVVRGPREAFNESILTNLTLLRRKIQNINLKFKFKEVGVVSKTKLCICYLEGVVNKKILNEVYKRIDDINIDAILESGYIEELIKDSPLSPFTTVGYTERPDIVAANVLEGRIAIFIDGTPHVLTVPHLFIEYFQANEDYYNGFIYSSINRILRVLAFFISTSLPAIYVALTTFHQEMIPTPLLLGISSAREGVPFPTVIEAILMLFAFEILREGGVRLPAPIGSSISFVGALFLGQAAVEARFVSAPIVIITALTGITNFLTPKMIGALISVRLIFLLLSSFLGLYGYIFGVIGLLIHLLSIRSFGVPYMSNIGSLNFQDIKDTAIRAPWWLMYYRPKMISKENIVRKKD